MISDFTSRVSVIIPCYDICFSYFIEYDNVDTFEYDFIHLYKNYYILIMVLIGYIDLLNNKLFDRIEKYIIKSY